MKRLALLLLAFTGLMSACSKDDPVPQDGPLTPDSPEGREAVTIPDEFLCSYPVSYTHLVGERSVRTTCLAEEQHLFGRGQPVAVDRMDFIGRK